jgi:hypothetical protein
MAPHGTVQLALELWPLYFSIAWARLMSACLPAAVRRALDGALCGATATAPRLASTRVRVRRAPEPSDILWQHTACTGSDAFTR